MQTLPQHAAQFTQLAASTWDALPPVIRGRLEAAGVSVNSPSDWLKLGKTRLHLWGVTRRMVRELDAIARSAL